MPLLHGSGLGRQAVGVAVQRGGGLGRDSWRANRVCTVNSQSNGVLSTSQSCVRSYIIRNCLCVSCVAVARGVIQDLKYGVSSV